MKNRNFEWQADEDEDLSSPSVPDGNSKANKKLWLVIAFILLTGIVTLLTVRFFNQQQRQLEEEMRKDVQASFDLWQKAVEEKDSELYAHLLSTGDRNWQHSQRQLFENDLIVGRSFWSLSEQNAPNIVPPEVTLSPDWQQATVFFEQDYTVQPVADFDGKVRLLHTAVFELQDANWLQSAPDEDFWGGWETLENDFLVVQYPARDAELVRRISRRLEADLRDICAAQNESDSGAKDRCAQIKPFMLAMSTTPESLATLDTAAGPLLPGLNFKMPAPTIAGLPVDESSFQAFYYGYTRKLLDHVRSVVGSHTPLPEQVIRTLCFNHPGYGMKLYKYDPIVSQWTAELPERSFRFMESLPGGQGLILDEMAVDLISGYSRIIHWQAGAEELLLNGASNAAPYRVINPPNNNGQHLLLRYISDTQLTVGYSSLDLRSCSEMGCAQGDLPGYTLWSTGEQQTILQIRIGVYLGDAEGQIQTLLGMGYNPFWLDDETAAYITIVEQDAGLITALVMNQVALGREQIVFDATDLSRAAGINEDDLSIRYVSPSPADPNLLLIHASGLNDYAGQYFIFSARLAEDREAEPHAAVRFHLQRKGSPGGDTSQVTPTGFLPFAPSPDGRWLLISELSGYDTATRTFILYDFALDRTEIISADEPVFPTQYLSYDWSDDGHWLVIAGDGFFRLLAPDSGYQQLVAHDFDSCAYTRWSD